MKSILRKPNLVGPAIAMLYYVLLAPAEVLSQSPVQQFTANYVTASGGIGSYTDLPASPGTFSACNTIPYTYTWRNGTANQLKLVSFTANSKTYIVAGIPGVLVKLNRVNNANVTGARNILYSEATVPSATACITPRQLDFKAPYNDDMASFLNNNVLNHGTDNIFTNASNGDNNNNNIERVDVVIPNGVSSALPADAGFILCERGNNNAHDGFRIAAILSIDASNNPTSFGAVKTCTAGNGSNNGSWGHPSIANGNRQLAAYVLRKDPADTYLKVSSNVNQELGGVFFSLADLGVGANQVIYGYCLIGPDGTANPSSAQLLNINNSSVYPTTTTEVQGGGLDLISVNTFFGTNQALASSYFPSLTGTVQNTDVILKWNVVNLPEDRIVNLERSSDGLLFEIVHSYYYTNNNVDNSFTDKPGYGTFYYRVQTSAGGVKTYSRLIQLKIEKSFNWKIFPTLVKGGETISIENLTNGSYIIRIQNMAAIEVYHTTFNSRNGKGQITLPQKSLTPGIYCLVLEKDGRPVPEVKKIVIRRN